MVGKFCAAPKGGGSAKNGVQYILGYSLGRHEKDEFASEDERKNAYQELMQESLMREDFGVGRMWKPQIGEGKRPSAIYAEGVTSLATADQEMDALAALGKKNRVREPTMHQLFSFNESESQTISDAEVIESTLTALRDMGLGSDHAKVLSVHRDTGNVHVHVLASAVNSRTGLAWERNRDQYRMAHGCRVAELGHGLERERGLVVTRETGVIELATAKERQAWMLTDREDRLDRLASKFLKDHADFEDSKSWAEGFTAQLNEQADAHREAGLKMSVSSVHSLAAKWGGRLESGENGDVVFSIRNRVADDERTKTTTIGEDGKEIVREGPRTEDSGIRETIRRDAIRFDTSKLVSLEQAEKNFIAETRENPSSISQAITALEGQGVLSREDFDAYIYSRVTDVEEAVTLSDYVIANDKTLRMVTADTASPSYVRKDFEQLQNDTAENMRALCKRDEAFDEAALGRAMGKFEKLNGYSLSDEQRKMCEKSAESRFSWSNGEAGAGKTTSMKVLKLYAKETGREIVGLATSQAAAKKLANDAGIQTFNLAKVLSDERRGIEGIPKNAIVIVDESSMTSYKAMQDITRLCRERNVNFVAIGDSAQLGNIEAGSPHEVGKQISQDFGSYTELREVRRQALEKDGGQIEWMRDLTARTGAAIRDGDKDGVRAFVDELEQRKAITWIDGEGEESDTSAAKKYAAQRYLDVGDPSKVLLTSDDRQTAKQINGEILKNLGLSGTGTNFKTERGTREFAPGMRVQFLKNDTKLGVDNNDLGTIQSVERKGERWAITVEVDSDRKDGKSKTVTFDPAKYRNVDYGYAVTTHKSQGQDRYKEIAVVSKITSANSLHVAATRATHELEIIVPKSQFANAEALGDHVADRIRQKDDVLLIERVIAKTGGPDTAWAKNVKAAIVSEQHPLRQEYMAARRNDVERVNRERVASGERVREMLRAATTPEARAEIQKAHRSETRNLTNRENAALTRTFQQWVIENKSAIETKLSIRHERHLRREERFETRNKTPLERDIERAQRDTIKRTTDERGPSRGMER